MPEINLSPEQKRRIIRWLAELDEKYSRPFSSGKTAVVSILGTESWTDYAQVVLQMMMADSLASIEQRLDAIAPATLSASEARPCPHCSQDMRREGIICPHCKEPSEPWSFHEGHWWKREAEGPWFWLNQAGEWEERGDEANEDRTGRRR